MAITPFMVFSVVDNLELHIATIIYCSFHFILLPTKVDLIVWIIQKMYVFT